MSYRHENLPWLLPAPADFRERCEALLAATGDGVGAQARQLATHNLDFNKLTKLSAAIGQIRARDGAVKGLQPFRLGILGNATTSLYVSTLPAAATRHGVDLALTVGEYDQVVQEALDPGSAVNAAAPDAVLLALEHHGLPFAGDGSVSAARALDQLRAIRHGIAAGCGAPVIFQTVACPPEPLFGGLDARSAGTWRRETDAFNAGLAELAAEAGDYILDIAGLAAQIGTQSWFDAVQWNLYKLPFAQHLAPVYAEHVGRLLGAIRGTMRKCLVLDLDNTLWGGVIGDDGIAKIKIGEGDGVGEAFLSVQQAAQRLRARGIVLAVSSKNDDAVARGPFREHPDMLLREDDIAVFQANWSDKASNLEAIARALDIGIDALVLLDDNPAERQQVRAALPMVAVPELPADPSLYARTLLNAGYFESISFSKEDAERASQYQANAKRAELSSGARDMNEFLTSLDMSLVVGDFDPVSVPRVAQLVNKTNQFNVTTTRYTQAQVEAMAREDSYVRLQARLVDRFGDNGLITVFVGRQSGDELLVENWLMSCRVLGRRVEEGLLHQAVLAAKARGIRSLVGRYVPSAKNAMVRDLFSRLGFAADGADGEETLWRLDVSSYEAKEFPFKVVEPSGSSDTATSAPAATPASEPTPVS